jgi:hypothetical protein
MGTIPPYPIFEDDGTTISMTEKPFEPSTVTKPIQLLAAWLIGLILINGSFLGAAAGISHPTWAAGFLVICAAANVPLFLVALFLLQTKFRPEMQEDTYYARYLERKSADTQKIEYIKLPPDRHRVSLKLPDYSRSPRSQSSLSAYIQINDLLPSFEKIVERLSASGIYPDGTFGSTSAEPDIPARFVISVETGVEIGDLQTILRVLDEFPVDGINISEGRSSDNAIYIGSYIYRSSGDKITSYTANLKKALLSRRLTWKRLRSLIDVIED